jgi:hypothetical protein
MPIKPENKALYPDNWKDISFDIRHNRAKNRCEICGLRNYSVGYRDINGNFNKTCGNIVHDFAGDGLDYSTIKSLTYSRAKEIADACNNFDNPYDEHYIVIVLTTAHLDHNPANCDPKNLKALCQRCHNRYDRKHRNQTQKKTRLGTQLTLSL